MMTYNLDCVLSSYIRLYGNEKREEIQNTIAQAKRIAENTGDDAVALAEQMLSDVLD